MDQLFPSLPSHAITPNPGTRAGTTQWGHTTGAAASEALGASVAVSMTAPLVMREPRRTILSFRVSAAVRRRLPTCVMRFSTPQGVALRLLNAGEPVSGGGGGVFVGSDGVPLGDLPVSSSSSSASVDVELVFSNPEAFLMALQGDDTSTVTATVEEQTTATRFLPAPTSLKEPYAMVTTTLCLADVLRPVSEDYTTDAFGQQWVRSAGETKSSLHSTTFSFRDAKALREVLSRTASLRVVEVIDTEWIAAALSLLPLTTDGGDGAECVLPLLLCHLAVTGSDTAKLTLRCPHAGLRAAVLRALRSQ